jgi:hypothetical protein
MNPIENIILGAAAITFVSACSSAAPDTVGSQTQPLASAMPAVLSQTGPTTPATAALAVLIVGDAGAQNASAPQLGLGDSNEVATLRGIALGVSSGAGVPSPQTMQAVAASDHQTAEFILCGAIVNDHAPVYVIKMTGGPFTATHHPPRGAAPQGSVLTVTVDAATHRVTDVGYVNVEPDLTQIGSLTVDLSAQ